MPARRSRLRRHEPRWRASGARSTRCSRRTRPMSKPQTRYDRHIGPRDRTPRVGDQEREAVSEILRREHVNGRIDAAEFQERLDRCLTARTYGDLDTLVADLPGDDPPRRRHTSRWAPRPWPVGV